jgi:hypothetical protein
MLLTTFASAKGGHGGGHGGGHCGGHGGHGGGHAHAAVTHVGGHAHASAWDEHLLKVDPRAVWQCGFTPVLIGESSAVVKQHCGAPETARQVIYGDARGEHVIDVWSYQPRNSQVRILKFENGTLLSVEAIGPSR